MRYRVFGRSGLRVSELCLGTMTFGEDWGWGASEEESRRIFDGFAEAGGNFIDTANNYTNGTSETFVGEFVHSDRDHFVVATKYSLSERKDDPNAGGNHRKNLVRSLEGSLRSVGKDAAAAHCPRPGRVGGPAVSGSRLDAVDWPASRPRRWSLRPARKERSAPGWHPDV